MDRLRQVVLASSDGDAQTFLLFVKNVDNDSRMRLHAGCLKIPFNIDSRLKVGKFIVVSVRTFIDFVKLEQRDWG